MRQTAPSPTAAPNPLPALLLGLFFLAGTLWYWQALRVQEKIQAAQAPPTATAPGQWRTLPTVALAGGCFVSFLLAFGFYTVQYGRRMNQLLREEIEDHEDAKERLRRSEARFRQVVEHLSEVSWLATPDRTRMLYVSPAYESIWGRTCESLLRNPEVWTETIHPEDRETIRSLRSAQPGRAVDCEYRIIRPDGAERWIRERASLVRNARGQVTALAGIAQDITAQKEAELALRRQHSLTTSILNALPEAVYAKDRQGRYLMINRAGAEFLKRRPDEVLGLDDRAFFPADFAAEIMANDRAVLNDAKSLSKDEEERRPDGSRVFATSKFPYRDLDGQVQGVIGISRDVTQQRLAEAQLRRSEAQLYQLFFEAPVGLAIVDDQKRLLKVNQAFCDLVGYEERDIIGNTFAVYTHPEDLAPNVALADAFFRGERSDYALEKRYIRKSGEHIWVRVTAKGVRLPNYSSPLLLATVENITARKQAEVASQHSEHLFTKAFEEAAIGMGLVSPGGQWLRVNQALCDIVGYTKAALEATTFQAITHPDDLAADLALVEQMLKGEIHTYQMEKRYRHHQGHHVWVLLSVSLVRNPDGSPLHFISQIQDISQRKRAEADLRLLHEQLEDRIHERTDELGHAKRLLQHVVDSTPDWIFVKDRAHRFLLVNRSFAASQGLAPQDMIGCPDTDFWCRDLCEGDPEKGIRGFHTDDREAFDGRTIHNPSDPATLADGTMRIFDTIKGPLRDADGPIYGVLCYCRDVTDQRRADEALHLAKTELERRVLERTSQLALANHALQLDVAAREKAEQALVRSEARYRSLFDDNPSMYFSLAIDGAILAVNRFGAAHLGYATEELIGRPVAEVFHPDDRAAAREHLEDCLVRRPETARWELRKTRKDGTVIWVQETVRLVQGADGRQTFLVTCDDITTRKQAELARREADLRYRTIFEQAGVGVARLDSRSGRFIEVNRRKCEILGYSASELLMTTSMAITHPEDLDRDLDNMGRLVRGEIRGFTMEKRLVRRDGAAVWVNLTVSPLWREGDEPREHIAVIEDITKSKQAADALRETERRTRAIVETAMDAVIVMDERGVITEWNPQAERIFAWTRAEAVGRRLSDTVIPARLRHSHEEGLRGYLRTDHGQVLNTRVEMPALRRDGTEFPVELAIAPLKLEGATIFAAFVRDITDRKGAEESLRLFRALLDQATDAVEVIDPATARFLDCNANAHEALGYSRAELLTLGVPDIDPLVPLPVFTNHIAQLRECGALTLETVHRRKDGSTFPVEVHGRLIRLDREYFLTIVRDITQRKKAEEERSALLGELQSANNALGRLSHQLMQVQEAERQQLARDLHDEIGQALTAVTINLQSLSQRQDQVAQAPEMRDSLTIVDRLVHHVRDLCLDLRPSLLDDLGLVPALRWFLNRQGTRAGWSVEFAADDAIPPLPEPVQVACFRIAQEALTNVMRHAGARRVGVTLRRVHDQLELTVTDDGIGFAVTPAGTAHGLPAGLGLAGMKERARYAGGEWTIQSSPGHGTTIRARLPISGLATTKTGQFSEVLT